MTLRIPNTSNPTEVRRAFQQSGVRGNIIRDGAAGEVLVGVGVGSNPTWQSVAAAIDHGTIGGLSDDDHALYSLVAGTRAFSGVVGGVDPVSGSDLTTKDYVDTAVQEVAYTPDSLTLNTGTNTGGNVASVQTLGDADTYDIDEVNGVPGFDVEFDFSGVESFSRLWVHTHYNGGAGHTVQVRLWNYDTPGWDVITTFTDQAGLEFINFIVSDTNRIDGSGNARLSIYHSSSGSPAHDIQIDYVAIAKAGFGSSDDHGALTGLSEDDHTIYLLTAGTRALTGNMSVDAGITIDGRDISVDGALLESLTDDSMADALHRHSELSASDGSLNPALQIDADGNVGIGATPLAQLQIGSQTALWAPSVEKTTFAQNAYFDGSWKRMNQDNNTWMFQMDADDSPKFQIYYAAKQAQDAIDNWIRPFYITNGAIDLALIIDGNGIRMNMPLEVQTATDEGKQAITIDQNDADQVFIDFQGTSAANADNSLTTWTAGNSIQGFIWVEINGVKKRMAFYDEPTS